MVALDKLTLRQLLDAYVDARLEGRHADMDRLQREINTRQARGEQPAVPAGGQR